MLTIYTSSSIICICVYVCIICWVLNVCYVKRVRAHIPVLPNPRFRCPIGLLLTSAPRPAKPYRYFATFGLLWLPGHEMSWNQAPLWKIVKFLSIQGDFEPFQCQWTDLSSIDRIKTSYGAIKGDYPQLPKLDNLLFFAQLGDFWLICHIKMPKIRHLGAFLLDEKLGYF